MTRSETTKFLSRLLEKSCFSGSGKYWAREAVWAYRKLTEEGQVINWRHIRDLTNMRNVDFQNCKEYLERYAEKEEAGRIKGVI